MKLTTSVSSSGRFSGEISAFGWLRARGITVTKWSYPSAHGFTA